MKSLKTFAAACAAALALAACEKENELPTVSFEKSNEVIDSEQEAAVKVVLSQAPAADLTVNFEVVAAGDLKDAYTIGGGDETSLVIKAGETEGTVTVRNNGTSLTSSNITLRLGTVDGYKTGINSQIVIALGASERIIYTFEKPKVRITANSTVKINVILAGETSGYDFKSNSEISLPILIGESTATENTDYTLSTKTIVFPAGSNKATFTITGGETISEPFPTLSLGLKPESEKFIAGAVPAVAVTFDKLSIWDDFTGTWNLTADAHLEDDTAGTIKMMEDDLGTEFPFPAIAEGDFFTIDYDGETVNFVPSFTGDLKRYFRTCTLSNPVLATFTHPLSYGQHNAYSVTFSTVNFDFGTTDSDLKEVEVYMEQDKENANTLDIFLFPKTSDSEGYKQNYKVHADFGGALKYGDIVIAENDFMNSAFCLHYRFTKAE